MTQEQKELLFKDLCARLPYGVKVKFKVNDVKAIEEKFVYVVDGEYSYITDGKSYLTLDIIKLLSNNYLDEIKPYLLPLSSMTEVQLKEMQEIIGNPNEACISVNTLGLELWLNPVGTDPTIWLDSVFEIQDWLNTHHFDYRGLIPKGLAIDATGKNIY